MFDNYLEFCVICIVYIFERYPNFITFLIESFKSFYDLSSFYGGAIQVSEV